MIHLKELVLIGVFGRELYTSPLIKIWLTKDEDYYVKNDKAIPTLSLDVATINYDEKS